MRKYRVGLKHHIDGALVRRLPVTSTPSISIVPRVGVSKPAIILSSVDLPQPDPPSIENKLACADIEVHVIDSDEVAKCLADSTDSNEVVVLIAHGRGAPVT